ncbi:MAG: hypothetical protein UHX00_08550 [Caryophanon sp.]|nr:hypothetical protein [Caryophanon sp.]
MRQYISGSALLLFALYLGVNGSTWWWFSLALGMIMFVLAIVNRKKS